VRAALILLVTLLLGGCLEIVDHTPVGACESNADCPCGQDCSVSDAGFHFCGARVTHGCIDSHDCQTQPDAGPQCRELHRDGGGCGYLVCQ
jgi:hypothetical protein